VTIRAIRGRRKVIDLRSDTVTKPTAAMREAMAAAEVGDDVYAEDPTVNELQRRAAEMLGKEAALFVPTGTMGNQIAIYCHTKPGQEVICESRSHVLDYEMGAMAALGGVIPRAVPGRDGRRLAWEDVRAAIRPQTHYNSATGLVCVENTHNMAGGTVMPLDRLREIAHGAREMGLPVHLDGARVFNAAAALGCSVAAVVEPVDTVMFCLSKGLAAPVGSILAGPRDLIEEAWLVRKMFGGGMRQVGVLAAAGLVALESMTARLADDHANARLIAEGVADVPGVRIDPETVQTNIVIFDLEERAPSADALSALLKERGILANSVAPRQLRMVTHNDVSRDDCLAAVAATRESMR
jgi:threonine aldolase